MKTGQDRSRLRPRARVLRIEPLENRNLLSVWPLGGLGPQLPGLPGASTATMALVCDSAGALWSYNASQGAAATAQPIGSTGVNMRELAFDGSSVFYGVDAPTPNHGNTSALYQISFSTNPPGNVQATLKANVLSVSGAGVDLNSLGYDTGTAAIWAAGSQGSGSPTYNLYKIDRTTFQVTNQWPLTVASGPYAGSYQPAGDIEFAGTTGYLTTTSGRLIQFSPTNPAAMQAANIPSTSGSQITDIEGLAYGHYSTFDMLLAFRRGSNNVYRMDPNLHQWVQYGSLGTSLGSARGATSLTASFGASPQPEISVYGTGQFGVGLKGLLGPPRTFLVVNTGDGPLSTGPITLPSGFVITEPLKSVIPAHRWDTFTVRLVTTAAGTFGGDLVMVNNDGDGGDGIENPYRIRLDGKVIDLCAGKHGSSPLPGSSGGTNQVLANLLSSLGWYLSASGTSGAASQGGSDHAHPSAGQWQSLLPYFDAVHAANVY